MIFPSVFVMTLMGLLEDALLNLVIMIVVSGVSGLVMYFSVKSQSTKNYRRHLVEDDLRNIKEIYTEWGALILRRAATGETLDPNEASKPFVATILYGSQAFKRSMVDDEENFSEAIRENPKGEKAKEAVIEYLGAVKSSIDTAEGRLFDWA